MSSLSNSFGYMGFWKKFAVTAAVPIICLLTAKVVRKIIKKRYHIRHLKEKVALRREEQSESIKRVYRFAHILPETRKDYICSLSFLALREELQLRKVTCTEVLQAYWQVALKAHASTNCICLFLEEAILTAEFFDKLSETTVSRLPDLFGIPISVKESINLHGRDCTSGFASNLYQTQGEDHAVIKSIYGAIPFVVTNIPQSLCSFGCSNPIYGTTTNPINPKLVPGGSSGGESALIACGGSILGLGTDIGGSIRIPATFCGIVGFKPSTLRMPHTKSLGSVPGRSLVLANLGPMARDVDTCIEFCRALWNSNTLYELDSYLAPVRFQESMLNSKQKLRIGYYITDDYIQPVPAYQRAVVESIQVLTDLGHECIPFAVPNPDKFFPLVAALISADGGEFLNNKLDEDLYDPNCDFGIIVRKFSPSMKHLLSKILPFPKLANILKTVPKTATDARCIIADAKVYRRDFMLEMQKHELDVIVCPIMSTHPPEHKVAPQIMSACNYTALYNLLDFAAGTVNVTTVNEEDIKNLEYYSANDPIEKIIKQQSQGGFGYPIGVQVAAPPYKEELVLRVLQMLYKSHEEKNSNH